MKTEDVVPDAKRVHAQVEALSKRRMLNEEARSLETEVAFVDVAYVHAQIEALTERRMKDPAFCAKLSGWGRKIPLDAQNVAVNVLRSGCRFFNQIGCGLGDRPIAAHYAVDFLVAIGAADKGRLPVMARGDVVHLCSSEAYYLLLDAQ